MLNGYLFFVCLVGPPGFLQEPEAEQIVSIGDFAYFTCVGSGAPPFNITWSKEGDAVCVFSSFFIIIIIVLSEELTRMYSTQTCSTSTTAWVRAQQHEYVRVQVQLPLMLVWKTRTRVRESTSTRNLPLHIQDCQNALEDEYKVTKYEYRKLS